MLPQAFAVTHICNGVFEVTLQRRLIHDEKVQDLIQELTQLLQIRMSSDSWESFKTEKSQYFLKNIFKMYIHGDEETFKLSVFVSEIGHKCS